MNKNDNNNTNHYEGALLEEVNYKFELILEIVTPLVGLPAKIDAIDRRLIRVEKDLRSAIIVLTGHSKDQNNHESRITKLETSI